ncbi:MAG TPA: hypothetical protein VFL17_23525, partial [Anaerolineae bacterium]|nr:hypothetical protein [Anaerolineae bacterium]
EVLGSLGTAHYSLGDVRRAIEIFGQALDIAQEIGNVLGAAGTCGILAEILVEHGLWADALSYAEYAAQIYAKAGYKQDAQKAQLLIAQIRKRGEK